jgi:hypothetical protein
MDGLKDGLIDGSTVIKMDGLFDGLIDGSVDGLIVG